MHKTSGHEQHFSLEIENALCNITICPVAICYQQKTAIGQAGTLTSPARRIMFWTVFTMKHLCLNNRVWGGGGGGGQVYFRGSLPLLARYVLEPMLHREMHCDRKDIKIVRALLGTASMNGLIAQLKAR